MNGFRRGIWCAIALLAWLGSAQASEERLGPPMRLGEVQGGTLLFPTGQPGELAPAPTLETDVAISVSGAIVRAQVTQRFVNPTDQWMEGIYVFPLPETAGVDHLTMYVGPRVIEGQIHEREAAKKVYEAAKASGRKASLVEQERPNVFTTSVANIGPGEVIDVVIEYQDTVPFDGVEYALRFPLVVAPRYIPGSDTGECPSIDGRIAPTDAVPDADRITPPLNLGPTQLNPVRLSVEVDPGIALKWLYSPTHAIVTQPIGAFVNLVTLADDVTPADRDFVLLWAPATGTQPQATLLAEQIDGETYALLTVFPPDARAAAYRIPRETVFVIDTSGSMDGPSIEQAKLALLIALDQLQPEDRFNVIEFNDKMQQLYPHSVTADDRQVAVARHWVESLGAGGGTEMLAPLQAALADAAVQGEVRQVIFMTDGQVGDEERLFSTIEERLGNTRLFTVGIGSAPNAYFMRKAAQFGRGTFTYVGNPQEVSTRMDELFHKLESPKLADIRIDWNGADDEVWPARVPDLYAGEPLVVAAKLRDLPERITVTGQAGNTPWRVVIPRPPIPSHQLASTGIGQLWARRKIEALMDTVVTGTDDQREAVRRGVIDIALKHHMVSNYTSLVAVDVTPTAPTDAELLTHDYPVNAPYGSALRLPSTATPARLYALLALLSALTELVINGSRLVCPLSRTRNSVVAALVAARLAPPRGHEARDYSPAPRGTKIAHDNIDESGRSK